MLLELVVFAVVVGLVVIVAVWLTEVVRSIVLVFVEVVVSVDVAVAVAVVVVVVVDGEVPVPVVAANAESRAPSVRTSATTTAAVRERITTVAPGGRRVPQAR
jgi:hypothetical protein